MGRRTKRGKGIPRLIQIRFDDAGPRSRRLLDLSRTGLVVHNGATRAALRCLGVVGFFISPLRLLLHAVRIE